MRRVGEDDRLEIARLVRALREARLAGRGRLPLIVFPYTARGVLALVDEADDPTLARGVLEVVEQHDSLQRAAGRPERPLVPVRFQEYWPSQFRAPLRRGQRRRRAHGFVTDLASRLVVPSPVGMAAVYVAGGRHRFERVGRTPGVARLLRSLGPTLAAAGPYPEGWYRADVPIDELYDPEEAGPLSPFFDDDPESG